MAQRITLDHLSERLGLSKFSVSRALSGKPGVSEQTREAVLRLAREVGYNHAGAVPAPAATRVVHLIIPQTDAIHSSFWVEVIEGAEAEARSIGYRLTIDVLAPGRGVEVLQENVNGLVLAGRRSRGVLEPFLQLDIPKVLIGHPRPMEMIDSVQAANFDGGYVVGDVLARLGHRCIAFFTDVPEDEGRNLRQAGLVEAMRVHGGTVLAPIPFDPEADVRSLLLRTLRDPGGPTALTGATDVVALSVAWGLMELGLRIPEHVSVIGANDSHSVSQLGLRLSTVRQPMHEIGATALQTLHWRLELASPLARPRRTLLTPEFIERSTHGPSNLAGLTERLDAIGPPGRVSAAL
jgi:LacI family transcriptional regulator